LPLAEAEINRLPCRSVATIYKGKYLDCTLDKDVGEVKARVWDQAADLPYLASLWWRGDECAITRVLKDDD